jgi:hypothetical protein
MDSKAAHRAAARSAEGGSAVSPWVLFAVLVVPRLLAAPLSVIGDCDEGIHSRRHAPQSWIGASRPVSNCSLQLLGTNTLSRPRNGLPDLGILAPLCHPELGLHCNPRPRGQIAGVAAVLQGTELNPTMKFT